MPGASLPERLPLADRDPSFQLVLPLSREKSRTLRPPT
jgi:hypothetical protein